MFRVVASTIEEYFAYDPAREQELRQVDQLIRRAAPGLSRHFVGGTAPGRPGMAMIMIGYGSFEYTVKASTDPTAWPIVGLALQKNHLSLYVAPRQDGSSFVSPSAGELGKARVGDNHLSFSRLTDLAVDRLESLLAAVDAAARAGERFSYARTGSSR
jgi:hypothetical protein